MHNPLVWNSPRTWTFDFKFARPQIYLLRDHLFLIQDLVKDWIAGSSTDLTHFVPTAYVLRITLDDFILNLCVNEHNIINNPTDKGDNGVCLCFGLMWMGYEKACCFVSVYRTIMVIGLRAEKE